jgi:hypothetical protein
MAIIDLSRYDIYGFDGLTEPESVRSDEVPFLIGWVSVLDANRLANSLGDKLAAVFRADDEKFIYAMIAFENRTKAFLSWTITSEEEGLLSAQLEWFNIYSYPVQFQLAVRFDFPVDQIKRVNTVG